MQTTIRNDAGSKQDSAFGADVQEKKGRDAEPWTEKLWYHLLPCEWSDGIDDS